MAVDDQQKSEKHLRLYLASRPRKQGRLEEHYGSEQSPEKQYSQLHELLRARATPADAAAASTDLTVLIDYLEDEVADKQLKERAEQWAAGMKTGSIPEGIQYSYNYEGGEQRAGLGLSLPLLWAVVSVNEKG